MNTWKKMYKSISTSVKVLIKNSPQAQCNTHFKSLRCFSTGMDCTSRSMYMWQWYLPRPRCQRRSFKYCKLEGLQVPRGIPLRGPLCSRRAQTALLSAAVCSVTRWFFPKCPVTIVLLHSGYNSFFSKGLLTIVPFQLGYNWGKLLTKANKNDCLSFVPHLGRTADVPGTVRIVPTFTIQEHPIWSWMLHHPAGTVKGHFTTQLIQLRLVRSCWDCRAGLKRSWGRGMYYHNKLSSVFLACINTQKYRPL